MTFSPHMTWLPALLALALTACNDASEQLEPETPDGAAPSYEQLNPPVPAPDDSSTAPATPDDQRQGVDIPLPGQGGDPVVPGDNPASQNSGGVATP